MGRCFRSVHGARVLFGASLGFAVVLLQGVPASAQAPVSLISLYNHATGTNPEVGAARAGARAAGHGVIDSYIGFGPRVTATYDKQRERQNVMQTQNPVYQTGKAYFGNQIGYGEAVQPVFDYRLFAQLKGAQAGERRESYL